MTLIVPGRSLQPPGWPVEIDRGSSLARGLISAGVIHQRLVIDIARRNARGAVQGTPSFRADPAGATLRFNPSSRAGQCVQMDHLAGALDGLTGLTYHVLCRFHGSSSGNEDAFGLQWTALQGSSDTNARRCLVRYDSEAQELDFFLFTTVQVSHIVSVSGLLNDGRLHSIVFRWDGAAMTTWVDGNQVGGSTAQTQALNSGATNKVPELLGGHVVTFTATDSPRFDLRAWGIWSRGLTDSEIFGLYDPSHRWALFKKPARLINLPQPSLAIAEELDEALPLFVETIGLAEEIDQALNLGFGDIALGEEIDQALALATTQIDFAEEIDEALQVVGVGRDLTGALIGRAHVGTRWWAGVGEVADLENIAFEADVLDAAGAVVRSLTDTPTAAGSRVNSAARSLTYRWTDMRADLGDDLDRPAGVINPGAESASTTGWTVVSGTWSAATSQVGLLPRGGQRFFGGASAGAAVLRQDIKIATIPGLSINEWINGTASAKARAWQANSATGQSGQIILTVLDGALSSLGSASTSLQEISPLATWEQVSTAKVVIPPAARYLRIELSREGGSVAFDDVEVVLTDVVGPIRARLYQRTSHGRSPATEVTL